MNGGVEPHVGSWIEEEAYNVCALLRAGMRMWIGGR